MTSVGGVQFGIPPETIKDSMNLGLELPTYYVIPRQRFCMEKGLNMAEFEFPAYFNFFIKRRKIVIVCHAKEESIIRTVFTETLLGPQSLQWPEKFSHDVPRSAYPDLMKEMSYFRKNPFNRSENLQVDTLLSFVHFDNSTATIVTEDGNKVEITEQQNEYIIEDNGKQQLSVPMECYPKDIGGNEDKDYFADDANSPLEGGGSAPGEDFGTLSMDADSAEGGQNYYFQPPYFGITMLGNSDGFDKSGSTTGFVLWINQRGTMVDPPPYSGSVLKRHGIHPRLINAVILTHCHADHDAGAFQKILESGRITLYTTRIIANSFLRKYSAISGMSEDFLQELFSLRTVVVGEPIYITGGHFKFFYSLHTIPCIGFEAFANGKSMVYSGDTLNDPVKLNEMFEEGFLSEGRRDKLLNFPFDKHDVVLHEAGVPPVHTPLSTFEPLSDEIKERLYIVHKNPDSVPKDKGLKPAHVGPKNTIVISEAKPSNFDATEMLELLSNIDLFRDLPLTRATELVQCAQYEHFEAGRVIVKEGSVSDRLYVIALGIVGEEQGFEPMKYFTTGDYLGAQSLVTGKKGHSSLRAITDCKMLSVKREAFHFLIRSTGVRDKIIRLAEARQSESWEVFCANKTLNALLSSQKTALQTLLQRQTFYAGDKIWLAGSKFAFALIVIEGRLVFEEASDMIPFTRGAMICETQELMRGGTVNTTLISKTKAEVYRIERRLFASFLIENPGLLLRLLNAHFVE